MIPVSLSTRTNYALVYLDVYRNNVLRTPIFSLIWFVSRMRDFVYKDPLMHAKEDIHRVKVLCSLLWVTYCVSTRFLN